ncbi:MAG: hypothetical protein IKK57_12545, partial [Clostridia bacterium]|nr:hypothetical protein [Clostridia bacterium]
IQRAQAQAQAAVSQENVYNMAVVAAQEIRDAAQRDAANLRAMGSEYGAGLLADMDKYLREMLDDIARQREALDRLR